MAATAEKAREVRRPIPRSGVRLAMVLNVTGQMVGGVGRNVAFFPDGSALVATRTDGSLREIDTATGEERVRFPIHGGRTWTVAFSPDGRTVVSGSWSGQVRFWRAASEQEVIEQGADIPSSGMTATQPTIDSTRSELKRR